jgi:opacity protein-like surface antigen
MKKFLIAAAGVGALAAAAPAAAQYYPAPQYGYGQPVNYGYGQPQGYGYGYNNRDQQGLIRSYIVRADQLRQRDCGEHARP